MRKFSISDFKDLHKVKVGDWVTGIGVVETNREAEIIRILARNMETYYIRNWVRARRKIKERK